MSIEEELRNKKEEEAKQLWTSISPSAKQCQTCKFAYPDTEYVKGCQKANCFVFEPPEDKPMEVLWNDSDCDFYTERLERFRLIPSSAGECKMDNVQIHEFINRFSELLNDNAVPLVEIRDNPEIGDGFLELGFSMDCGNSFVEKYGKDAFKNPEELEKIIDSEGDIQLIGSAVFSKWRYYNHWSMDGESIRDQEPLHWFNIIIKRILELTNSQS